jgi:hypothetical protein
MRVRLDENTLKAVAQATDGAYFNASTEKDLHTIYENLSTHPDCLTKVRHPRQSRWLDECDRLKGGRTD